MTKDELYKMLTAVPANETDDEDIPIAKKDNGDGTVTLSTVMSVGKDEGEGTEAEKESVAEDADIEEAGIEAVKGLDCETLANRRLATQVILSIYSSTEMKANALELLKLFWQREDVKAMVGLGVVIAEIKKKGSLGEDGFARVKDALKKVRTSLEGDDADAIYKRCSEEVREKIGGLLTESLS